VLSLGAITLPLNYDYSPDEVAIFCLIRGVPSSSRISRIFANRSVVTGLDGMKTVLVDGLSPDGSGPLSAQLKKVGQKTPTLSGTG